MQVELVVLMNTVLARDHTSVLLAPGSLAFRTAGGRSRVYQPVSSALPPSAPPPPPLPLVPEPASHSRRNSINSTRAVPRRRRRPSGACAAPAPAPADQLAALHRSHTCGTTQPPAARLTSHILALFIRDVLKSWWGTRRFTKPAFKLICRQVCMVTRKLLQLKFWLVRGAPWRNTPRQTWRHNKSIMRIFLFA